MKKAQRLLQKDQYVNSNIFNAKLEFANGQKSISYTWNNTIPVENQWLYVKKHLLKSFLIIENNGINLEHTYIKLEIQGQVEIFQVPLNILASIGQFIEPIRFMPMSRIKIDLLRRKYIDSAGDITVVFPAIALINDT